MDFFLAKQGGTVGADTAHAYTLPYVPCCTQDKLIPQPTHASDPVSGGLPASGAHKKALRKLKKKMRI